MVNMRKEIVEICAEVEIAHGALLRASSEFEEQADWGDIQLAWGR